MFGGGGGGRNANDDDNNFHAAGAEEVMMGQDVEEDRTDLLRIILYGAFYIATYYIVEMGRRPQEASATGILGDACGEIKTPAEK